MDYIENFEKKMKDWGYYYPEFAGCELLGVCEDNEIKGNCIYPSSGDWVVHDNRGKSGVYGVSHEESYICALKLKNPKDYNIDTTQEPLMLQVDAETLLYRYQWIGWLFSDWNHGVSSPYRIWNSTKEIYEVFELEKNSLEDDPYLALYWLLHFALTADTKYKEIREIVLKYKLQDRLFFLETAMLYFDNTDVFTNILLSNKPDTEMLFLRRRSYLIFETYSYNYRSDDIEKWWLAMQLHSIYERDSYLINKIRWLRNNIKKHNCWTKFEKLLKDEDISKYPFLSYIYASFSNDKEKYANLFLDEVVQIKDELLVSTIAHAIPIMVWDIRESISDMELLKQVVDIYFKDSTKTKEYLGIAKVLGLETPKKEDFTFPYTPLSVHAETLSLTSLIKQKSLIKAIDNIYFYINKKVDKNFLEWDCAFIVSKKVDTNGWTTFATDIFKLKDFNNIYKNLSNSEGGFFELEFLSKKATKYKKYDLKPINFTKIIELLTSDSFSNLESQKCLDNFVVENGYDSEVVSLFENYASVRKAKKLKHYLQFFVSEEERIEWVSQFKRSENKLYKEEVVEIKLFSKLLKEDKDSYKAKYIISEIVPKNKNTSHFLYHFSKYHFKYKESVEKNDDYTLTVKGALFIDGDIKVHGTFHLKDIKNILVINGNVEAQKIIFDEYVDARLIILGKKKIIKQKENNE